MKRWHAWAWVALGMAMPCLANAADGPARVRLGTDTEFGVKGIFQYDWAHFSDDRMPGGRHLFDDDQAWRREQVSLYLQREGGFKINAGYDFATGEWVDNDIAFKTRAGKFQVGEFRTLVGWENASTSSKATTFIEAALPVLVTYEGRRAGVGWTFGGIRHWTFQAQWFLPHDLNHDGDGRTLAARAVYAPVKRETEVVHLGLSVSRETREGRHARFRSRPETNLTPVRLLDTGKLDGVRHINRAGLEVAWMRGPLLVQGEYLGLHAQRDAAADVDSHGGYLSASWMLTGESRTYKDTAFGNPQPRHAWGAFGIGVRYSRVDLDDGPVRGGSEHDWTVGLNWYIGQYFKLQANEVYAVAERGSLAVNPHIFELRAQVAF